MQPRYASPSGQPSVSWLLRLGRLLTLALPVSLLAGASLRATSDRAFILWLGTLFQALAFCLTLIAARGWGRSVGPSVIMLYVIALSWTLLGSAGTKDWYTHLVQAILLVVPLLAFALQTLRESGAPALRRARLIAHRLSNRTDWPASLAECRLLPEVKALREALHIDASPALALLGNSKPQVRVAALAALEFRQEWRYGQPDVVLSLARRSPEPEIRCAAIYALANLESRMLIEALAEFLHDRSLAVRQAAADALFWDRERRWPWMRLAVRHALAEPNCQDDGPLRLDGQPLPPEAVSDLTAWAGEKGILGLRAAQSLGAHYALLLAAGSDLELIGLLRALVIKIQAPPMLRLELARLLQQQNELDGASLQKLLDPSTPAPLRLIGVEALLARGPDAGAVAALHELARLPNREIALATAEVVQRRLGVELGLPRNQPLPPVQSRPAAEVARRLMNWAHQLESGEEGSSGTSRPAEMPRRSYSEK